MLLHYFPGRSVQSNTVSTSRGTIFMYMYKINMMSITFCILFLFEKNERLPCQIFIVRLLTCTLVLFIIIYYHSLVTINMCHLLLIHLSSVNGISICLSSVCKSGCRQSACICLSSVCHLLSVSLTCQSSIFYLLSSIFYLLSSIFYLCASVRPCVRASVRPCVRASVRPCVRASVRPCVRASVRPSVRPSSVRPSVRPSIFLSVPTLCGISHGAVLHEDGVERLVLLVGQVVHSHLVDPRVTRLTL